MEVSEKSPSMELQIDTILLLIMLGLALDACWKWNRSRKGMDSGSFTLKTDGELKLDFQRESSSLSFNGEGLGLLIQSLRARAFKSEQESFYL